MTNTLHARILNALKNGFWIKRMRLVNMVGSKKKGERKRAVNILIKNGYIESFMQIKVGPGRNPEMLKITEKGLARHKRIYG